MLLGPPFSFRNPKLFEDVNTPAEGMIVSCVLVELIKGRKFFVGDSEICLIGQTTISLESKTENVGSALTLKVALNSRQCNTLGQDGRASLDNPRNEHLSKILVEFLSNNFDERIIDDSETFIPAKPFISMASSTFSAWWCVFHSLLVI
jgi:hypothetical protein